MPSPQARLDLDRILRAIDAKAAVVILVGDDNELETATRGIDNDVAIFEVCFSIARQLADGILAGMSPEQKANLTLAYPTLEEARSLGLVGTNDKRKGRRK